MIRRWHTRMISQLYAACGIHTGGTQYKRPYRDVPPTWVAKSASGYMNDPLHYAKFGIWMGRFLKMFPNLSQNWLKFKKILENQVILLKIWHKVGLTGIWLWIWVTFSWKNGICMGLPKPNLSTPTPHTGLWPPLFLKYWGIGHLKTRLLPDLKP